MKKLFKQFKKFTKECPNLRLGSKDSFLTLDIICPYTEEERGEGMLEMERNVHLLKADAVLIPEMRYLSSIMEMFYICVQHRVESATFSIDFVRLKYCKTFLAYTNEEYTEAMLAIIDNLQDQMIEKYNIKENDLFYFAETED